MTMATPKAKRQAKAVNVPAEAQADIGKSDIKRAALTAWAKLDAVIQTELSAIQSGSKELNASTATAIVKYIETSLGLASGQDDLSPKDASDRNRAFLEKISAKLPTFDDEPD